ncbi:GntR family transcriptional regulator [Amaricoccus solimangrovi]|uniref:GntR family transcriptional regulator n=1 Tax=Amaricoccus solimangrovi TaxID=2589815 RepID=UPI001F1DA2E6|nr:GntR family transcriptional regulator [Amaricoccus solimangrovi]
MDRIVIATAPSVTSQVYDWMRERVLRGELAPGARLSETEIAGAIGVSRQPVREAFIRLASDGLAEVRPQRGTYIGKISVAAVLSARLIREAVESDLARMVAADPPVEMLARMAEEIALQERADAEGAVEAFIDSDDRFHRLLATGARQEAVWHDLEKLKSQMNRLRHMSMRAFDRAGTIGQHRDILEALRRRSPDAAERAVRAHLRQMLDELPRIAARHPDFFTD